jgi:alanine racemase
MHRFGIRAEELLKVTNESSDREPLVESLKRLLNASNNIKMTGVYTHFQQSYEKKPKKTREQFDLFINVLNVLRNNDIEYGIAHCANTSAFFKYPEMRLDAVRIGSAFSGRCQPGIATKLSRIGYLESRICETRYLKAGDKVFYSGMYTCKQNMKVGIVEAGYYEGFDTIGPKDKFKLSNKLRTLKYAMVDLLRDTNNYVIVNGKKAKVLGRIGMKNFVIDLSQIDANINDAVKIDIGLTLCNIDVPRELI